ncbi:aminotransferase class III-fold pyridoxal phosphate-dependent enzyme [Microcella frigidaquae]|uniref:4-aminobutyrate aminotransferase-like enzyme n=1 Tax=Microcella frigidaquae TaxID=424758 RepID=A0A840X5S5_9MICO|nr:4-aminobutyrate aminotransferase-like enzyme [Microcella frigidaquae]NHN45545.1 aminotransferase class III-fold pyridoxal phosphate-dependent enzyme [Microcella frigidaquae]
MIGPATYYRPEHRAALDERTRALIDRREAVLSPGYRLFYAHPVEFVRGSGTKLYTRDGEEFLDVYNNVPVVGHAHPRVAAAIAEQAARLNTHTRYLDEGLIDYAERLVEAFPAALDTLTLVCTGSEANDLALRVAKQATGHRGVIVTENAYHGVTTEIAAISPSLGGDDSLAAWTRTVRPPVGDGRAMVADAERAIAALQAAGHGVAALIVDTAFASDGFLAPSPATRATLAAVAAAVRAAGGLVIADEVQPGFGRLGATAEKPSLWGFVRHGLDPDLVTIGKPMANGLPVAGLVARRPLMAAFGERVRYFNTFAGTPVSVAAARATWEVLHDEGLPQHAGAVGAALLGMLRELTGGHPRLRDPRGAGLYLGVDVVDPATGLPDQPAATALVSGLRERRILISASGRDNAALKIRPPLPFSHGDAERFITELEGALRDLG